MAIGNFIKNNLALVAGLAVPVVLVVGFLVVSQLGRLLTDPPRHIAYFIIDDSNRDRNRDVSITLRVTDDGRLEATRTTIKPDANNYRPGAQSEILVSYDFATGKLSETPVSIPTGQIDGTFIPESFKDIRISKGNPAPDGYKVYYSASHSSFPVDIFRHHSMYGYRARKGAAVYRLPQERSLSVRSYSYYTPYSMARFVGWSAEPATDAEVQK